MESYSQGWVMTTMFIMVKADAILTDVNWMLTQHWSPVLRVYYFNYLTLVILVHIFWLSEVEYVLNYYLSVKIKGRLNNVRKS